jgi:hypothetical protein
MGNSKSKKPAETSTNGQKNQDLEFKDELKKLVQDIRDREYRAKLDKDLQEERERKSKDPEEIEKFRQKLNPQLTVINKPMRLDEYIELNNYYPYLEMFNEFQPSKAYYVVPLSIMTGKLYNALDHLNQITQIKYFTTNHTGTYRYEMHLNNIHYIVLKITKPILDKLLEPEDITKELELLARFTSNREFTSTPAKELTHRNVTVKEAAALYSWTDFENTFKLKFKQHGFLLYKVRKNKIELGDLFDLHEAYLYYYSDDEHYGWLCYPEKDAKKISSLDNLDEKEQTEVLATLLGVELDRVPEFTAVAELPSKPVEVEVDGNNPEIEVDGNNPEQEGQQSCYTAVADWPKPPERMPSVEGQCEEGQQEIQLN